MWECCYYAGRHTFWHTGVKGKGQPMGQPYSMQGFHPTACSDLHRVIPVTTDAVQATRNLEHLLGNARVIAIKEFSKKVSQSIHFSHIALWTNFLNATLMTCERRTASIKYSLQIKLQFWSICLSGDRPCICAYPDVKRGVQYYEINVFLYNQLKN